MRAQLLVVGLSRSAGGQNDRALTDPGPLDGQPVQPHPDRSWHALLLHQFGSICGIAAPGGRTIPTSLSGIRLAAGHRALNRRDTPPAPPRCPVINRQAVTLTRASTGQQRRQAGAGHQEASHRQPDNAAPRDSTPLEYPTRLPRARFRRSSRPRPESRGGSEPGGAGEPVDGLERPQVTAGVRQERRCQGTAPEARHAEQDRRIVVLAESLGDLLVKPGDLGVDGGDLPGQLGDLASVATRLQQSPRSHSTRRPPASQPAHQPVRVGTPRRSVQDGHGRTRLPAEVCGDGGQHGMGQSTVARIAGSTISRTALRAIDQRCTSEGPS